MWEVMGMTGGLGFFSPVSGGAFFSSRGLFRGSDDDKTFWDVGGVEVVQWG